MLIIYRSVIYGKTSEQLLIILLKFAVFLTVSFIIVVFIRFNKLEEYVRLAGLLFRTSSIV